MTPPAKNTKNYVIVKERLEDDTKGIKNLFNKIIAEKFPNLENEIHIPVNEGFRILNGHYQKTSPQNIIVKHKETENKDNSKTTREKNQVIYR